MPSHKHVRACGARLALITLMLTSGLVAGSAFAQARDPGVRHASSDGGPPPALDGLSPEELAFYQDGLARFTEVEVVSGAGVGQGSGLGPRFNSNQCSSCHLQPYVGGSSPASNPLIAVAHAQGAANTVPWFIVANGPVREVRFVDDANGDPDGGVHDLFVVSGRSDAGSCGIAQPNFGPAGNALTGRGGSSNVVFRIPTPTLGAGLIEAIPDGQIRANMSVEGAAKQRAGIFGHPNALIGGTMNFSGNDGTVTRFGWKAQNKSLLMFSGEAYNVEMGISNQLFPQERDETPNCQGGTATPNDTANFAAISTGRPAPAVLSDIEAFANFMRLLAPPSPAPATASAIRGSAIFSGIGCTLCHTPAFTTGTAVASGSARVPSAALTNKPVRLFSDLLVHHMGAALADGISQGSAGPDEFRTAPLWGLGQRIFFLHDGRTQDLVQAIQAHASTGSEANQVVQGFGALTAQQQQDLLNFLRSL
jgi:CxxC motif-containing protein (DUF1111 family)